MVYEIIPSPSSGSGSEVVDTVEATDVIIDISSCVILLPVDDSERSSHFYSMVTF